MYIATVAAYEFNLPRAWRTAVGASLAMHLLLLVWLSSPWPSEAPGAAAEQAAPSPATLQLTFATRNPQRPLREPVMIDAADAEALVSGESPREAQADLVSLQTVGSDAAGAAAELPASSVTTEDEQSLQSMRSDTDPALLPVPNVGALPDAGAAEVVADPSAAGDADAAADGSYSIPELRASISTYVRSTRQQSTGDWLAACRIHQKQHGARDCPQQQPADYSGRDELSDWARQAFASVLRPQQHARLRGEFAASMAGMTKLMETPGPLGELAATRYYRDKGYLNYLSGNVDFGIRGFVQASQGLQYDPNFLQVICNPAPCIFEFTGVGPVQTEARVDAANADVEPAGGADEAFAPRQTLFGSRRR